MGQNSKIEWTDHTWSPWLGCSKVSPGCAHCYITTTTPFRVRGLKHGEPRQRVSESTWKQPERWNKATVQCDGRRPRVFPSLMDWLDDEVPIEWLADFLKLIHDTPNLSWLLLTKRPENFHDRIRAAELELVNGPRFPDDPRVKVSMWLSAWRWANQPNPPPDARSPENVWIGVSVENQKYADERIPALLKIPAKVRFLSCEPLLGPVDIGFRPQSEAHKAAIRSAISWVIAGGESGKDARPMHPDWARSLRDQCQAAGVPFFFKQWGEYLPCEITEDTEFTSGRAFDIPGEGRTSATIRERSTAPFTPGKYRPMKAGDVNGLGVMLDDNWIAAKVGKKAAGRLLDGKEHNKFPKI